MLNFPLFPDQASTMASQVDYLYFFIIAVTVFFGLLVTVLAFYFAFRYRKERNPVAEPVHGSMLLEITWTVVPLIIALVIFVWAAWIYYRMYRTPKGAMEVYVIGKQWMWKVEHPSGVREINQLHVPINRDVKLIITSQDVIHAVFIPAFRVKADAVPGVARYSTLWFNATKPGTYHLFCAEYCGTHHSGMIGQVIAMDPADYERWLSSGGSDAGGSMASSGEKLFTQLGCISCHTGQTGARGPNLAGVYGSQVQLSNGQTVVADEAYIKESILSPTAKIVAGYQPIMPSFQGQISEEGILQIVEYIKTKSQPAGGAAAATAAPASATAPSKGPKK